MSSIVSFFAFLLIIGLVIFVHEFGHFLLAKMNGVGVVEFSIGLGPKIVSWVRKGTRYSIKWIPFGGYCLMLGQDLGLPDPGDHGEEVVSDEASAFENKPLAARIAVTAAGPVFNFILAFIFAFILAALVGARTTKISAVTPGYPAEAAGLAAGDEIVKLGKERVHLFKEVSIYLTLHEDESMKVVYLRDGEKHETVLTPKYSEEEGRYLIGIISGPNIDDLSFPEVCKFAFYDLRYNMSAVVKSLGMLFSGKASLNDLSGPVGMAGMVNDIVEEVQEDTKEDPFWTTVYWTVINLMNFVLLISANLGIMNLLPIPGMDGGRLLFQLIELVMHKPVPKKAEGIVTLAGILFLLLLMIAVLFNDIRKVFF